MAASVSSEAVGRFWPVIEAHARKLSKVSYLAEFDDLVQEGAIAVWQTLEKGGRITNDIILNAQRNWIRFVTHEGRSNEAIV